MLQLTIQKATIDAQTEIINLLKTNNLHTDDLQVGKQLFWTATLGTELIGCAAIELYEQSALFRSFAIAPAHQRRGYGRQLYNSVLSACRSYNIDTLYLLTTTAAAYFDSHGWVRIERQRVPADVALSAEFASICPSSAVCMCLPIANNAIKAAVNNFQQGCNCSQAVFAAFAPQLGLEREFALKLTTGFGGGIAHKGEICGAVSGAYMSLGMKFGGNNIHSPEAKELTMRKIQEFDEQFTALHKSLYCKQLLPFDISEEGNVQKLRDMNAFKHLCPAFVKDAAEILLALIEQDKKKE